MQKNGRVMRLKPRHNPDVNDFWMCDEGRYNYHFIDENRIQSPQYINDLIGWDKAIDLIARDIRSLKESGRQERIGVIASAQLTNEDLFTLRKLFRDTLNVAHITFKMPAQQGTSDDFLIKADKNPNTAGAEAILGESMDVNALLEKAKAGQIDLLYVFGQDLVKSFGKETVVQVAKQVKLFVYQGSNINETCNYAHVILPSSVYAEKDGTFTNFQGRVQRISPAFLPIAESKGDWDILVMLALGLGTALPYKHSSAIFSDLAMNVGAFAELNYEKIGDEGQLFKK